MPSTPRLNLPLMSASQAQKHVTFNEAVTMLDLLSGVIPALDRSLTAPPVGPVDGDVHILGGTGTGDWAGYVALDLALRLDGAWFRVQPTTGMLASIADEGGQLAYFNGSSWANALSGGGGGSGTLVEETGAFTTDTIHYGSTVRFASPDLATVTLANDAPAGAGFSLLQVDDGQARFLAESGASLHHASGHDRSAGLWTECRLIVESNAGAAASWVLTGSTQAASGTTPSGLLKPFVDFADGAYVFGEMTFTTEGAFMTAIGGTYAPTGQPQLGPFVSPGTAELLSNGDFASGSAPGWVGSGSTIAVIANELQVTGSGGNGSTAYVSIAGLVATSGKAYQLAGKVRRGTSSNVVLGIGSASGASTANYAQTANLTNTSMVDVALYCGGFHASTPTIAVRHLVNPSTGTYFADDLSLKEALPYDGFVAGELCAIIEATTGPALGADRIVFQADDNAEFNGNWLERNFVRLFWDAAGDLRLIVSYGGTGTAVEQVNINLGAMPVSTAFAVAFTARGNDFRACQLGRPVQADNAGSFPGIAGIRLKKGRSIAAGLWTGTLERLRLFPRAASEIEFLGLAGAGGVAAWGDSLTAGAGATGGSTGSNTYPAVAEGLFTPSKAVLNLGLGGQTSTQIAARMNAQAIAVTVSGDEIPAAGGVAITAKSVNILTNSSVFAGTQTGWIGGVKGVMSTDAAGNWTFTRESAGAAVAVSPGSTFTTELGQVMKVRTAWLWLGRNGAQPGHTVEGDIAAAVASIGHNRYLVGSILTSAADSAGAVASVAALNSALSGTYGTRYVDVLGALQAAGNGSVEDNADIAAGYVPRSLRSDAIHLNDAGYAIVADAFKSRHAALGF